MVICTPYQRLLVVKCVTTSVRLTSGQMYPLRMRFQVRLTFSQTSGQTDLWQMYPSPEASCGEVCYYFGQTDL